MLRTCCNTFTIMLLQDAIEHMAQRAYDSVAAHSAACELILQRLAAVRQVWAARARAAQYTHDCAIARFQAEHVCIYNAGMALQCGFAVAPPDVDHELTPVLSVHSVPPSISTVADLLPQFSWRVTQLPDAHQSQVDCAAVFSRAHPTYMYLNVRDALGNLVTGADAISLHVCIAKDASWNEMETTVTQMPRDTQRVAWQMPPGVCSAIQFTLRVHGVTLRAGTLQPCSDFLRETRREFDDEWLYADAGHRVISPNGQWFVTDECIHPSSVYQSFMGVFQNVYGSDPNTRSPMPYVCTQVFPHDIAQDTGMLITPQDTLCVVRGSDVLFFSAFGTLLRSFPIPDCVSMSTKRDCLMWDEYPTQMAASPTRLAIAFGKHVCVFDAATDALLLDYKLPKSCTKRTEWIGFRFLQNGCDLAIFNRHSYSNATFAYLLRVDARTLTRAFSVKSSACVTACVLTPLDEVLQIGQNDCVRGRECRTYDCDFCAFHTKLTLRTLRGDVLATFDLARHGLLEYTSMVGSQLAGFGLDGGGIFFFG